jgi:hypothetical protein
LTTMRTIGLVSYKEAPSEWRLSLVILPAVPKRGGVSILAALLLGQFDVGPLNVRILMLILSVTAILANVLFGISCHDSLPRVFFLPKRTKGATGRKSPGE